MIDEVARPTPLHPPNLLLITCPIQPFSQGFFAAGFDGSAIVGQSTEGLGVLLGLVAAPRLTSLGGAHIKCFEDLAYGRAPCHIPLAAERGITLHQLRTLWLHVQCRCVPEGWMSVSGELLTPERVDMCDLMPPHTHLYTAQLSRVPYSSQCSLNEALCTYYVHLRVRPVCVPCACLSAPLLGGSHRYDLMRYVVKPATRKEQCSYVELVAAAPQRPSWVVIHWYKQQPIQLELGRPTSPARAVPPEALSQP